MHVPTRLALGLTVTKVVCRRDPQHSTELPGATMALTHFRSPYVNISTPAGLLKSPSTLELDILSSPTTWQWLS